jgi:hypothetical protein
MHEKQFMPKAINVGVWSPQRIHCNIVRLCHHDMFALSASFAATLPHLEFKRSVAMEGEAVDGTQRASDPLGSFVPTAEVPFPGAVVAAPPAQPEPMQDGEEVPTASNLMSSIQRLNKERKTINANRAAVVKELRNARRRNKRLKSKTRLLSQDDLLEVLQQRRITAALEESTSRSSGSADPPADGSPR